MDTIFWLENVKGRDHAEDPNVDGKIILDGTLRRRASVNNEPSDSI
jgi:hypothetical protein